MTERTLPAADSLAGRQRRPRRRSRLALPVIVTCQLMIMLDVTVMNVALPRIQATLHFSPTGLSWVINAYTLVFGGMLLLGGRAGDLLGRRRMFVGGVALFTAASLAGGLATSAAWLLAARVAQGLGGAAAAPNTLALITSTFTEPRERVKALAIFSGIASGGFTIGLIVGGLLTDALSWRWVMFINVPLGLAVTALAPRHLPAPEPAAESGAGRGRGRRRAGLDLPGALTATGGVAGLVYAFIRAATEGWADRVVLGTLAAGLALIAAFLLIETRASEPLLPLRLFADRNRAMAYLNFFIGPLAMFGMFFFLTQFLQEIMGLGPLATGLAFLPMAVVMFTMTRFIPRLLPKLGPRRMAVTGTLMMVAGLIWLTQVGEGSAYATGLLAPMILMGAGVGLAFSPLNVLVMSTVAPRDAGAAGGALQTMQQVGASLGLAVLVTIFGHATRVAAAHGASAQHALVAGMSHAFVASTIFALCTLAVATTFRRPDAA
ncbi:MAG TPA: MFS transporter [Streptosporangiaceae bacterium]